MPPPLKRQAATVRCGSDLHLPVPIAHDVNRRLLLANTEVRGSPLCVEPTRWFFYLLTLRRPEQSLEVLELAALVTFPGLILSNFAVREQVRTLGTHNEPFLPVL
jgi:hypothetical protein